VKYVTGPNSVEKTSDWGLPKSDSQNHQKTLECENSFGSMESGATFFSSEKQSPKVR